MKRLAEGKPTALVCSSQEGLAIAECIQVGIGNSVDVTLWTQGVFPLSTVTIESLEGAKNQYDWAIIVVTPDDIRESRGHRTMAPNGNVVLELGFFIGALGRNRTLAVCEDVEGLPSDLDGVTVAKFSRRSDGNLLAALGSACTLLKDRIRGLDAASEATPNEPLQVPSYSRPWVQRRRRRRSLGLAVVGPSDTHHIVDISVTGAFLETDGELPVGKEISLSLDLEDGTTVSVAARVVRVQRPAWKRVGGVGVKFTHFPDGSRELLEQYIEAEPVAFPNQIIW